MSSGSNCVARHRLSNAVISHGLDWTPHANVAVGERTGTNVPKPRWRAASRPTLANVSTCALQAAVSTEKVVDRQVALLHTRHTTAAALAFIRSRVDDSPIFPLVIFLICRLSLDRWHKVDL